MVKIISTVSLKPGYDPDETYRIWVKEHVPYVKSVYSGLQGYVIGRVLHSLSGGEFYGVAQLSYETLDDAIRAQNRTLVINPPDEFLRRTTDARRVIIQEEDVMGNLKLK